MENREIPEPLGLPTHLGDERARLAAAGWQQHLHARREPLHGRARRRRHQSPRHGWPAIYTFRPAPAGDKMPRVSWTRRLLLLVLLAAVTGCASGLQPPPRQSRAPRTRCLSDPNEGSTRPLFFLFCVESP